jgi:hypothetical protein
LFIPPLNNFEGFLLKSLQKEKKSKFFFSKFAKFIASLCKLDDGREEREKKEVIEFHMSQEKNSSVPKSLKIY